MKVHDAICLEDYSLTDGDNTLALERGRNYTVSPPWGDGTVTVFSRFWARVPVTLFGGFRPPLPEAEKETTR